MERQLVLSSHSVKKQGKNKPSDFTIKYNEPIRLNPNKTYVLGLDRIITMSFTWFNINSDLKNQLIKYSSDGGKTWKDINFPPGTWNYVDFNDHIKEETKTGTASNPSYPITLEFDNTTYKTIITLAANYQLDLRPSNFNDLIGFRRSKDLEKHLTIKNCDKTFRKNIIKRLKNTTFRCTLHHYQVKLKMQDCGYKYKNGQ